MAVFNFFAYEIDQVNAAIRVFVKTGTWEVRRFDDNGLPISTSNKIGEFVSPFYVVHYGLIYSDGLSRNGLHWRSDPSIKYWNIHPKKHIDEKKLRYFRNSADWVLNNISMYKGHSHLLYDFYWPYKNYPNGGLSAPWWSGLTDGYALILLLRAYDHFGDDEYYLAAQKLYESVLTPTDQGGSLSYLNGCPWIEEYVDPRMDSDEMSFVLNGMVYATYGIEAFEDQLGGDSETHKAPELYECIESNLSVFDLNGWSYYDALTNSANIKYHNVNYAIFLDMVARGKIAEASVKDTYESWSLGFTNPGIFYLIKGPFSIAYLHFILTFVLICLSPLLVRAISWIRVR